MYECDNTGVNEDKDLGKVDVNKNMGKCRGMTKVLMECKWAVTQNACLAEL